jgi:DNA-binding CsgD family transcriptional regulator
VNKHKIHIAIIEPSSLVYEGISNILLKSGMYIQIFRIDSVSELSHHSKSESFDFVLINPMCIQNKIREFATLRKCFPDVCWVGLVYNFYESQLLSNFNFLIQITDSTDTIFDAFHRQIHLQEDGQSMEHEQLSEREMDVLRLVTQGLSNKEIADKLNISIHTVISHRKNISQKTGIKSQSGLTIYAISNKIISLEDFAGI